MQWGQALNIGTERSDQRNGSQPPRAAMVASYVQAFHILTCYPARFSIGCGAVRSSKAEVGSPRPVVRCLPAFGAGRSVANAPVSSDALPGAFAGPPPLLGPGSVRGPAGRVSLRERSVSPRVGNHALLRTQGGAASTGRCATPTRFCSFQKLCRSYPAPQSSVVMSLHCQVIECSFD